KYLTHIELIQRGNANQSNITVKDLQDYETYITSKKEQTKIASFLSNVDEKISQLTQKHQLLSQYKQGMMQKLFSQQIRFKADDGSEFGEWEETSLHTFLCESLIKGSKGNKAKKLTVKLWGKGVIPKNEAFQGSENTQYYKRSAGQLIYGKLDFLNCAFGLIPEYLDGFESTIDAPAFDIDNKIVHPYFLINRFLQKDFYQKNGEEADGSRKAKRINQSVFLAMQIGLPSLEEQTKIANFLSAIDQKIEVMAQQIEQAKTWKKGLLQQMFVQGEIMAHGKSIKLFLTDGSPNGILTAEIMNWTGHVLSEPRTKRSELIQREECARTGVYFLVGHDPENSLPSVYIGESDDVANRLRQHNRTEESGGKDFWEKVCLVTGKDQNITKTHIKDRKSTRLNS